MFRVVTPQMPPPKGKAGQPVDSSYYELFKVEPDVAATDLKKAFRRIALKHHPDKGGDPETFQKMNHAYEVLQDEEKRACYDAYGPEYEQVPGIDMYKQSLRSPPSEVEIRVPLKEIIQGTEKKIRFQRRVGAHGRIVENVSHVIKIPPGAPQGYAVTLEGAGHHIEGKLPGNVHAVIVTECPPGWKRQADCLLYQHEVNILDLLLARPIKVTHAAGHDLWLQPSGANWDLKQWYKIDEEGVTEKGDLFVTLEPMIPFLTPDQKQALQKVWPAATIAKPTDTLSVSAITPEQMHMLFQRSADQSELYDQMRAAPTGPPNGCPVQ